MKTCYLLLLALISLSASSQSKKDIYLFSYFKGNGQDGLHLAYSYDVLKWTALHNDSSFVRPTAGKDKLMRDPCIVRGADGQFHMVWTVSWNEKGIGYAHSKDLLHWSEQQYIPVMEHEPTALNCWAPEIFYDEARKEYMIYWATTIPGRFPKGDSTGDNKYNHRLYYVTTKDFKTFSPTKLLYDPGFNVIDATIQKDGQRYVMWVKDETRYPPQKNLKIAYSDSLTGGYSAASEPITGKYWAEGPTVLKYGKRWIIYFDKYTEHKYGAIASTDLKNWTDVSDELMMPKGIRHGSVFVVTKKELRKLTSEVGSLKSE
jgi:hypothetical protein